MELTLFRAYISVPAETGYHRELLLDIWEDTAKSQGASSVVRSAAVIEEMEYIAEKGIYTHRVTGPVMPGDMEEKDMYVYRVTGPAVRAVVWPAIPGVTQYADDTTL